MATIFLALVVEDSSAEVRMKAPLPKEPIVDKPERPTRRVVPVPIYGVNL